MPPPQDNQWQSVAEAIADGQPVPWNDVDAEGVSSQKSSVVHQLKVLAALAELHRTPDPAAGDVPVRAASDETTAVELDAMPTWGPLRLLGQIGRGTFGAVYRAWDPRLDREVALKLIPVRDGRESGSQTAVAEGRMLARVRHANIITVYGAEILDGRIGIWMELLHGRTLQQELMARGSLSAREAALIGLELARALAAVHKAQLVHRDVKAQNVMREEGGRIVLMDFGAGRDLLDATGDTVLLTGTPLYMAPELFDGHPASPGSDLYSVGVLLYHLVTNDFPVTAPTLQGLKAAHAVQTRRRLRDVRPDLPAAFIQAVERATAVAPGERTPSAAALEFDLEQVIRSPGSESAAGPKAGRHRWLKPMPLALVMVLLAIVAWGGTRWRDVFPDSPSAIRSLAVLPFENLTGQSDQAYLADGVTELLIGHLAHLPSVRVISRTSAMSYRGTTKPLGVIARELGIDGIVEGSVSRSGDRLRVSVQLLRPNESRVWGQTYERPVADLFKIQAEISGMIAEAIQLSLTPTERRALATAPAIQVQAQDAFLRGLQRLNLFATDSLKLALADLLEAVRLDPTSARAYAALSQCYLLLGTRDVMTLGESYSRALAAATRALQLDDNIAEAHTELAEVKFYYEWNWDAARGEYERALALNPNGSHAIARYSLFLSALERHDDALRYASAAQALDPLSAPVRFAPGMALFYARRYDAAVDAFARLAQSPPYALFPSDHVGLARSQAALQRFPEAVKELEAAITQGGPLGAWIAELARIRAESGDPTEARRIVDNPAPAIGRAAVEPVNLAFLYIALGEYERAFSQLDLAADLRSPALLWAKVDPRLDRVRADPRYRQLLARIGLPR